MLTPSDMTWLIVLPARPAPTVTVDTTSDRRRRSRNGQSAARIAENASTRIESTTSACSRLLFSAAALPMSAVTMVKATKTPSSTGRGMDPMLTSPTTGALMAPPPPPVTDSTTGTRSSRLAPPTTPVMNMSTICSTIRPRDNRQAAITSCFTSRSTSASRSTP